MDYYELLGVSPEATTQEIKKAFRQIARECHPDVAGEDAAAAERFKSARTAYETLVDPVTRSRYDRRGQRRSSFPNGSFFDAFYRQTGGQSPAKAPKSPPPRATPKPAPESARRPRKDPGNDLNLDDLFQDFGDFGFGSARRANGSSRPPPPAPPPRASEPRAGADVHIDLEVPFELAEAGGTLTAVYSRLQRAEVGRLGEVDGAVVRTSDIADIRIIPGTRHGEVLRERGLGDAGVHGGAYGDLLVSVRLLPKRAEKRRSRVREPEPEVRLPPDPPPEPEVPPEPGVTRLAPDADGVAMLEISVVEAILGGRVEVRTPRGRLKLTIPPGTSSGTTLRLKGKGGQDNGRSLDLYVRIRIIAPQQLDEESQRLIREFARLNPGNPRA